MGVAMGLARIGAPLLVGGLVAGAAVVVHGLLDPRGTVWGMPLSLFGLLIAFFSGAVALIDRLTPNGMGGLGWFITICAFGAVFITLLLLTEKREAAKLAKSDPLNHDPRASAAFAQMRHLVLTASSVAEMMASAEKSMDAIRGTDHLDQILMELPAVVRSQGTRNIVIGNEELTRLAGVETVQRQMMLHALLVRLVGWSHKATLTAFDEVLGHSVWLSDIDAVLFLEDTLVHTYGSMNPKMLRETLDSLRWIGLRNPSRLVPADVASLIATLERHK